MTIDDDRSARSETVALLHRRSSVRRFAPDPVPEPLLRGLLTTATRAPTTFNFQGYSLVVATDPERRACVAELTRKPFLADAPVFVLVCADLARLSALGARYGEAIGPEHDDLVLSAVIDASLVGMSLALAAESVGLGTVMIGAVRNRPADVAGLFALPDGVRALFGVAVGYPADVPQARPRAVPETVLHRERYAARADGGDPDLCTPDGGPVSDAARAEWEDQVTRGVRVVQKRSSAAAGYRLLPPSQP